MITYYSGTSWDGILRVDSNWGIDKIVEYFINGRKKECWWSKETADYEFYCKKIKLATPEEIKQHLPRKINKKETKNMQKLIIVPAPKLEITYKTAKNEVKNYTVTVIDRGNGYFTGYAYKHGLRSFRDDRVINIKSL